MTRDYAAFHGSLLDARRDVVVRADRRIAALQAKIDRIPGTGSHPRRNDMDIRKIKNIELLDVVMFPFLAVGYLVCVHASLAIDGWSSLSRFEKAVAAPSLPLVVTGAVVARAVGGAVALIRRLA